MAHQDSSSRQLFPTLMPPPQLGTMNRGLCAGSGLTDKGLSLPPGLRNSRAGLGGVGVGECVWGVRSHPGEGAYSGDK